MYFFLQGVVVGLDNLDAVIQIIRETSNHAAATKALVKGNVLEIFFGRVTFPQSELLWLWALGATRGQIVLFTYGTVARKQCLVCCSRVIRVRVRVSPLYI
jgi:DNA gyrase/topoisomerase IV subunit A